MSTRIVPDMSSSPALARYRAGPAPFALVTGATAGMGEAWAHALAAHGFNLLLHGRSPAKLAAVRDAVLASFPTRDVRLCVLDACALPPDARELEGAVAPLNLRIVVNNVGGSGGHFESVLEMPSQQLVDEITCNAVFPTLVAKVTLPKLRTGGPGLMLNISSIGGIWPSP
jgi:17beta-estradiol 17-dehydrogenase / very-long-chain 3-oxoacyl-CoA reductase